MITQWLTQGMVETVGEAMYIISFLASTAIAFRMWGIWKQWRTELAPSMGLIAGLFSLYWLYCLARIHTGCTTGAPNIDPWLCSEMAFWTRIAVAAGSSAVAWWWWRMK